MAACLILFCLGLVAVMLCGTTPENIARILTVIACLVMVAVSLGFYFRPDLLEKVFLFLSFFFKCFTFLTKVIVFVRDLGLWGNVLMGFSFLVVR